MNISQFVERISKKISSAAKGAIEENKYQQISSIFDLNGYKRIYLVHIRKTGGTSLNNMFLSLSGEDPGLLYDQLSEIPKHHLLCNGLSYVG